MSESHWISPKIIVVKRVSILIKYYHYLTFNSQETYTQVFNVTSFKKMTLHKQTHRYIYIYIYICVCVCVCVLT